MITQARLKELLNYDPKTGIFTWLIRPAQRVRIGDIAGCKNKQGYLVTRLDGVLYYNHRLAVLYMEGKFSENGIDHFNTIKSDNKWSNLREATKSENAQNQRKCQKSNKSTRLLGAYYNKVNRRFFSSIEINEKSKYLGTFNTAIEAHEAYLHAKEELHPFQTLVGDELNV